MALSITLRPPYYAVIFTTQRTGDDKDGYNEKADELSELVEKEPGFLGMESVRDETGQGITVCYWDNEESIANWKKKLVHQEAQQKGMSDWYKYYFLRIAKVERDYGKI